MDSDTARALAEELAKGNQGQKIIRQIADHRDEINVHAEVGLNRTFEQVAATVWHERESGSGHCRSYVGR